jgi:hypothetical protein
MKANPWHSKVTKDVHHDETTCKTGNNIETYNKVSGTGGLPKCSECKRISGEPLLLRGAASGRAASSSIVGVHRTKRPDPSSFLSKQGMQSSPPSCPITSIHA